MEHNKPADTEKFRALHKNSSNEQQPVQREDGAYWTFQINIADADKFTIGQPVLDGIFGRVVARRQISDTTLDVATCKGHISCPRCTHEYVCTLRNSTLLPAHS